MSVTYTDHESCAAAHHPPAGAPKIWVVSSLAAVSDARAARRHRERGGAAVTYQIW
jgi:hypothetical protein